MKPKISRTEASHTSKPWTYLEVEKSMVKVTGTINAVTESVLYLPKGKAYELLTWYADGAWRPIQQVPWPPRSKVKVAVSRGGSDISQEGKDP